MSREAFATAMKKASESGLKAGLAARESAVKAMGDTSRSAKEAGEKARDTAVRAMGDTSKATKEAGERARETAVAAMGSTSEATKEAGMQARETAVKAMGDTSEETKKAAEQARETFEKQAGMVSEQTKQAINQLYMTFQLDLSIVANALNSLGGLFYAGIQQTASFLVDSFINNLFKGVEGLQFGMPFSLGVPIGEQLAKQAPDVVKRGSPAIRISLEEAIGLIAAEANKTAKAIADLLKTRHSPVKPEEAAVTAGIVGAASTAGFIGLAAAASAIETMSLGQLEIPGHFLLELAAMYGLARMAGNVVSVPYRWGIEIANNYYWAKIFQPEIPSLAQADDMLFHGAITPEQWSEIYSMHGWGKLYQEAWRKTFYAEPSMLLVLSMLRDPEVPESFIRETLKRRRFSEETINVIIDFKRRQLKPKPDVYGESELISLYKEGFINDEEFNSLASELGWPKDVTNKNLMLAKLRYEYDYRADLRDLVLERLRKGKISPEKAVAELSKIMPAAERVAALVERELAKLKLAA